MLDGCGVERLRQFEEGRLAGGAVVAEHPDLDQAVRPQRGVSFLADSGSEPFGPDGNDGVEVVSRGAVFLALGGCELDCRHVSIINAP